MSGAIWRLARRDSLRAPGRSLLIALMVALPVAGASFIDVVLRTAEVRGAELIPAELGDTADARVLPGAHGDRILQRPDATFGAPSRAVGSPASGGSSSGGSSSGFTGLGGSAPSVTATGATEVDGELRTPPVRDPLALLPAGSRAITDRVAHGQVRTTDGLADATFRGLDLADPLAAGQVIPDRGRLARTDDEVVVSTRMLEVLGRRIGDRLEVIGASRRFTIVGTVRLTNDRHGLSVVFLRPDALTAAAGQLQFGQLSYLVRTPKPVSWQQVLAFNDVGIAVFSRAVLLDPPPESAVPAKAETNAPTGRRFSATALLGAVLVVGLTMAEVALLAGAAFAVGARRQSRSLGLLAATGGTRRQVRSVVLAQGALLGVTGGLAGAVAGTGFGALAVQVLNTEFDRFLPALDLRPAELFGLVGLGVVTGLMAAVLPARGAARQDVVAALSGRRGVVATRRRYPLIGLVAAGLGAGAALLGGAMSLAQQEDTTVSTLAVGAAALLIVGGAVLTQVGLIVATPALIGGAARLGRWLPLAPRLALRDAARHRGRSAPAVAAILAAVAGSSALTVFVAAQSDRERREYQPSLAYGEAVLRAYGPTGQALREGPELLAAVRSVSRPDDAFVVRTVSQSDCREICRSVTVEVPLANRCPQDPGSQPVPIPVPDQVPAGSAEDPRCTGAQFLGSGSFAGPPVGTYRDFVRLSGVESLVARDVLARGGLVVFDPRQVKDGRGVLKVSTYDARSPAAELKVRDVDLPAAYVRLASRSFLSGFASDQAAAATGVGTSVEATIVRYDAPPSDHTEEAVTAALAKLGQSLPFTVERGYRDHYGSGLLALLVASAVVTLGAAGIATGLAQADARGDHATLAAVGAPPRMRRLLAASQAGVIAALGAVLGTVSGLVPMIGFLQADSMLRFVAPWQNLLVITVLVPVVAAAAAGLLTRSRLPMGRRVD